MFLKSLKIHRRSFIFQQAFLLFSLAISIRQHKVWMLLVNLQPGHCRDYYIIFLNEASVWVNFIAFKVNDCMSEVRNIFRNWLSHLKLKRNGVWWACSRFQKLIIRIAKGITVFAIYQGLRQSSQGETFVNLTARFKFSLQRKNKCDWCLLYFSFISSYHGEDSRIIVVGSIGLSLRKDGYNSKAIVIFFTKTEQPCSTFNPLFRNSAVYCQCL